MHPLGKANAYVTESFMSIVENNQVSTFDYPANSCSLEMKSTFEEGIKQRAYCVA